MPPISAARYYRFEVDELGCDTIRFRSSGVMESARYFRDRDRLYFLYRESRLRSAISPWPRPQMRPRPPATARSAPP